MLWWTLLAACTDGAGDTGVTAVETADPVVAYEVTPAQLDFGSADVGTVVTETVHVHNTGNTDLLLIELAQPDTADFDLSAPSSLFVSPGATADLVVTWTPTDVGQASDQIFVTLGASTDQSEKIKVPLEGTASGPVLTMSVDVQEFGEVKVGCSDQTTLTLSNAGNAALVVDSVDLDGSSAFELVDGYGTLAQLPWTLEPFESQEIELSFAPTDDVLSEADSVIASDDPVEPQVEILLTGLGAVDGENLLTYTVGEQNRASMLFHINECALEGPYGTYATQFESSLPTFFQTLIDNHVRFRVAFLWSSSGTVGGDVDYIDESYTAEAAAEAAMTMLEGGGTMGDNDQTFTTLYNGVSNASDWLFEDDYWTESKLSLIAVNRDVEQSGGSWSTYVSQFQSLKDDPEDVVFHAIAGPPPSGCGSAEYFSGFYDAVSATDGVFLSICETDWTEHMEGLAAATMDGADFFVLEGEPLVSSIQVSVDDITWSSGWSYDTGLNAVVFDDDVYPDQGATVEIYYLQSDGCG